MNLFQRARAAVMAMQGKFVDYRDLLHDWGIPVANLPAERLSYLEALGITTVWCACQVRADGVAQVPWRFLKKTPDGRIDVDDHPLADLIRWRPNPVQTSFELREQIVFHYSLTGEAHLLLDRVGNAREIVGILPIEPGYARTEYKSGRLRHFLRDDAGGEREIDPELIWHIRGPQWHFARGLSIVKVAAQALGLARHLETAHARLFKNGAQASGVLSFKTNLTAEKYKLLRADVEKQLTGENQFRPLVVDQAGEWQNRQMTGVDAQHVEARKLQVEEIARAFRIMPIMLMQADKAATYASAEQMFIAHVVHSLTPHYRRLEQSASVNLLTKEERAAGYYTEFDPAGLMRGALKDQGEYFARALGAGGSPAWMTQNQVRALLNLPRDPDALSDVLARPAASTMKFGEEDPPPKPKDDEE